MGEINVVPYIDVALVLLIIFMITAPLLVEAIDVNLPQTGGTALEPAPARTPLVLTIDINGNYYLNVENEREALDSATVRARVSAILENDPLTPGWVRGDEGVTYGTILRGAALLTQSGVQDLRFVVLPFAEPPL